MANYKAVLAYDGTAYHGFQVQKNSLTIQEVLEKCLERLYGQKIRVVAAGRTDRGVHARGQVINFNAPPNIPAQKIPYALNNLLPADIVVRDAEQVEDGFHALRDARVKCYSYTIDNGTFPDVFLRNYAWHLPKKLDVNAMRKGAFFLLGKHDFKAFQAAGSSVGNTVRQIFSVRILEEDNYIRFVFEGDGFLYKMVRNMVGTLVEVGLGKRRAEEILEILKGGDRRYAGFTAPAKGLCLEKVLY